MITFKYQFSRSAKSFGDLLRNTYFQINIHDSLCLPSKKVFLPGEKFRSFPPVQHWELGTMCSQWANMCMKWVTSINYIKIFINFQKQFFSQSKKNFFSKSFPPAELLPGDIITHITQFWKVSAQTLLLKLNVLQY